MRFLSCVRCRTSTIRVRGKSRWSRNSPGGIQTVGSVPLRCSRLSPRASSLSVLLISPIISFALRACTKLGNAARGLDLVDNPVPVADRLDRDGRSTLATFQEFAQRAAVMLNPFLSHQIAVGPDH